MAMRKVDSVFPKRKNANVGATVGKGHSRVTKKSKDALSETHEGVSSKATASLGAAASQPAALIASGSEDVYEEYDDMEEILRQFDMNLAYGPCLGMTRLGRWERAQRIGLNPPQHVKDFLERAGGNPECLWEGRV